MTGGFLVGWPGIGAGVGCGAGVGAFPYPMTAPGLVGTAVNMPGVGDPAGVGMGHFGILQHAGSFASGTIVQPGCNVPYLAHLSGTLKSYSYAYITFMKVLKFIHHITSTILSSVQLNNLMLHQNIKKIF